jgi:hypothetical protein
MNILEKIIEFLTDIRYKISCLEDRLYGIPTKKKDNWTTCYLKTHQENYEIKKKWRKEHPIADYFISLFNYFIYRLPTLPKDIYREIYWFIQRGKRGYSDRDIWGFNTYLSNVIVEGLKQLKEERHGYPLGLTPKKWDKILVQIIEGFELTYKGVTTLEEYNKDEKFFKNTRRKKQFKNYAPTKTEVKKVERAFKLFHNHFCSLWD